MDREHGLSFVSTEAIRGFLDEAASCSALSSEASRMAMDVKDSDVVPYVVLRDVWKQMPSEERPAFRQLLQGAEFALQVPKPREKSKELKERLQKLQELAEEKAYEELVKDINKKPDTVPFSTYKDQLGFGLHVIVTMFTGFLLGFALFRSQFQHDPVLHVAGGLIGLFLGMLLETTLFIVRDYQYENARIKKKTRAAVSVSKKKQ